MHLPSINDRLKNPKLSYIEKLQREVFLELINDFGFDNGKSLSVSCGDGVWDYLALSNKTGINNIVAVDIVPCPVNVKDQLLLKQWLWEFVQVKSDGKLPFNNGSFDFVWHIDVIEHTEKPYLFLSEQYRVLREGGKILVGTPNLLRPANMIKACLGKLTFPVVIGHNVEIGDYVHVQEFHEQQLKLLMTEVGFVNLEVRHVYLGLTVPNFKIKSFPKSQVGKTFCHFLMATASKG